MSTKNSRREAALKREKKKKAIIAIIAIALVVALITGLIIWQANRPDVRVFEAGASQVRLYEDGTFSASLPHGMWRSGRFSEDGATISFTYDGRTVVGGITSDALTIPDDWVDDATHNHPTQFRLRR